MTNTYKSAENTSNRQFAMAYAVYEILGSLYHKCRFNSPIEETHLKMHFFSKKVKEQIELENSVIGYLDKKSLGQLPILPVR